MTFNVEGFMDVLEKEMVNLPKPEQEILLIALDHAKTPTDFQYISDWLLDPIKWRMPKVSVDTFLNDEHYL